MTETITKMSRQPVTGWREEGFVSDPEGDSVLMTLVLDIYAVTRLEEGLNYNYFGWRRGW